MGRSAIRHFLQLGLTLSRLTVQPVVIHPPVRVAYAIAASLLLAVISWGSVQLWVPNQDDALVTAALDAHNIALQSNELDSDLSSAGETVEILASVVSVVGASLSVPDLTSMEYALASVQVMTDILGDNAVVLDYRDREDNPFTLFLDASPGPARFEMLNQDGTRICIWQDDVLSAVMVGDMAAAQMLRLASLAYNGLGS